MARTLILTWDSAEYAPSIEVEFAQHILSMLAEVSRPLPDSAVWADGINVSTVEAKLRASLLDSRKATR